MDNVGIFKLYIRQEDQLHRIKAAEKIVGLWKRVFLLLLLTVGIYGLMAWFGLGSQPISKQATAVSVSTYESLKLFFVLGRMAYGLLVGVLLLFFSSFLFWGFTRVPYRKLLTMQLNVVGVLLVERIFWIVMMVTLGLEWFVSPLSFGIIASYFTDKEWIVLIAGVLSIVQVWIVWFQYKFIRFIGELARWKTWILVLSVHILYWACAVWLTYFDVQFL